MKIPSNVSKSRLIMVVLLLGTCVFIGIILGIVIPFAVKGNSADNSELDVYSTAAVSTDTALCAPVGRDILERNGSAVDSAIAMLLCMGVVNPYSSGIGGGFFMTIFNSSTGKVEILDARETAPKNATKDMFLTPPASSTTGGLSIAVPGEVMGYHEAHKKYGALSWRELFQPAIDLCRNGFQVGRNFAAAIFKEKDKLLNWSELKDLLFNNETKDFFKEGEIMKNEKLANTLEKISEDYNVFYNGKMTKQIVEEIRLNGGIITEDDMAEYKALWKEPVEVDIGLGTLYSVPVPGSGSVLGFMVNVFRQYNSSFGSLSGKDSTVMFHRIVETFKYAYGLRMQLGDLNNLTINTSEINIAAIKELLEKMRSENYAKEIREMIYDNMTFTDPKHYTSQVSTTWDSGTAHVSVVAPNGDAVSVTSTINLYFGSKLRSRLTGIIFNNEMDDFSSPNSNNSFGLPPSEANFIAPEKRPMSSMNPSIIVDKNKTVLMVVGGNGGSHITSATALVILRSLFFNETIKEAIDAPRIHHQLIPNRVFFEDTFDQEVISGLRGLHHDPKPFDGRGSVIMGIVRQKDGTLSANSDFRKGGATSGF